MLCHYYQEPGWTRVHDVLMGDDDVWFAAPSILEFLGRLATDGLADPVAEEDLAGYREMATGCCAIDEDVAHTAWALRRAASARLPAVDSLIAASAAQLNATLLHCDAHFDAVPATHLRAERVRGGVGA